MHVWFVWIKNSHTPLKFNPTIMRRRGRILQSRMLNGTPVYTKHCLYMWTTLQSWDFIFRAYIIEELHKSVTMTTTIIPLVQFWKIIFTYVHSDFVTSASCIDDT